MRKIITIAIIALIAMPSSLVEAKRKNNRRAHAQQQVEPVKQIQPVEPPIEPVEEQALLQANEVQVDKLDVQEQEVTKELPAPQAAPMNDFKAVMAHAASIEKQLKELLAYKVTPDKIYSYKTEIQALLSRLITLVETNKTNFKDKPDTAQEARQAIKKVGQIYMHWAELLNHGKEVPEKDFSEYVSIDQLYTQIQNMAKTI